MARPESGKRFEGVETPEPRHSTRRGQKDDVAKSKSEPLGLLEFLRLLGVKKALTDRRIEGVVAGEPQKVIEDLSDKLMSSDSRKKGQAEETIQKILQAETEASLLEEKKVKKERDLGLVDLVNSTVKGSGPLKDQATMEARQLQTDIFAFVNGNPKVKRLIEEGKRVQTLPAGEQQEIREACEALFGRVDKLVKDRLSLGENIDGLLMVKSRLSQLAVSATIARERFSGGIASGVGIERQMDVFRGEDEKGLLTKIRRPRGANREEKEKDERRLKNFREQVVEDFERRDGKRKVEELTIKDLLERVQDAGSWRAGASKLVGKEGAAFYEEVDAALVLAEEGYIEQLAEKMKESLKIPGDDRWNPKVADWVREAVGKRRGMVAGKNQFKNETLKWDELKEDVNAAYYEASRRGEREAGRSKVRTSQLAELERMAGIETPMEMYYGQKDRVAILEAADMFLEHNGLEGFTVDQLLSDDPVVKGKIETAMRGHWSGQGLAGPEIERKIRDAAMAFEGLRASMKGQRGNLEFGRLEKELNAGNHQKYLFDLKAYFERVGPRESSSDWELAMIIRRAQEMLSRPEIFGGELGNNFKGWQEQLFARGNFAELNEKDYVGRLKTVLGQDQVFQLEAAQQWMNGIRVHVKSFDEASGEWIDKGEKRVLSSHAYFQMLQRETYADKTLSPDVNTVDSMQQQIMVNLLYGDGATIDKTTDPKHPVVKDASGKEILKLEDIVKFEFFNEQGQTVEGSVVDDRDFGRVLGDAMVFSRDAEAKWFYSLEWRNQNIHFHLDRYRRINKNILKYLSLEAYDGHYGPAEAAMRHLFKAGALLPDFFTYKLSDVQKSAMVFELVEQHGVSLADAQEAAGAINKHILHETKIGRDAKFVVGRQKVDNVRLITKNMSQEQAWAEYVRREGIKTRGRDLAELGDYNNLVNLANNSPDPELREKAQFFLQQANEFHAGLEERRLKQGDWNKLLGLDPKVVRLLNQKLLKSKDPSGGMQPPDFTRDGAGNVRSPQEAHRAEWEWFFENFEYSAVVDYSKFKKQSDVNDFAGYFEDQMSVYGLMQQYGMIDAPWSTFEEIITTLQKYQPAKAQVERWAKEAFVLENKLRTNQTKEYEICDSDENYQTIYKTWTDPKTGRVWYLQSGDGFRVPQMKKVKGNYMKETRGLLPYRRVDIEVRVQRLFGKRLFSKAAKEDVLQELIGPNWMRWARRIFEFDDPIWALFILGEETKNLVTDAVKKVNE